jgi:hypothetical protein
MVLSDYSMSNDIYFVYWRHYSNYLLSMLTICGDVYGIRHCGIYYSCVLIFIVSGWGVILCVYWPVFCENIILAIGQCVKATVFSDLLYNDNGISLMCNITLSANCLQPMCQCGQWPYFTLTFVVLWPWKREMRMMILVMTAACVKCGNEELLADRINGGCVARQPDILRRIVSLMWPVMIFNDWLMATWSLPDNIDDKLLFIHYSVIHYIVIQYLENSDIR